MASIWELLLGAAQAAPPQPAPSPAAIPQQLASGTDRALLIKQGLAGSLSGEGSPEYKYWLEQRRKKLQAEQGAED